jgi:hypothetical protein
VDAYRQQQVVAEPDLAASAQRRWLAFSSPAVAAGARAAFGFPLQVGTVRLGALNLYRDRAGALGDEEHADALGLADLVASWVLERQASADAGEVPTAFDPELGADFHYWCRTRPGCPRCNWT